MSAVDVSIMVAIVLGLGLVVRGFVARPGPRHRWGELESSDVAHAIRRRQRP